MPNLGSLKNLKKGFKLEVNKNGLFIPAIKKATNLETYLSKSLY